MGCTGNYLNASEICDYNTAMKQLAGAVIIRLINDMQQKNYCINYSTDVNYRKRKLFYSAVEYPLRYPEWLNFWLATADMDTYADDIIAMARDKFKQGYIEPLRKKE
mgnify:FL=1|jgi:hypothetical protein